MISKQGFADHIFNLYIYLKFFHKKTSLPQLTCTFKQQQPQQNDLVFITVLKAKFK